MSLPNVYLALQEHREWERRFNARAARGEFVRDHEDLGPSAVDVLRRGLSELVRGACLGVAAFINRIRRPAGTTVA